MGILFFRVVIYDRCEDILCTFRFKAHISPDDLTETL